MTEILPILILNGRPAAGKSEVIHYLDHLPDDTRREHLHLGKLYELDDFPMLWTWFEEDDVLVRKFGRPRLHTDAEGNFIHEDLWHLLIERLSLDYEKLTRDQPGLAETHTILIEFSRGSEHGGYRKAYSHLSDRILEQGAIFYIDVSYEESLRKNRRRYNPNRPDSILEHGLPDHKLERLYKEIDWADVSAASPEVIRIRDHRVPYAVFLNQDDVTTSLGPVFEQRMKDTLDVLWQRWQRTRR